MQALLVAGLASVVAAALLLVFFLDHPYHSQIGALQPTAMRHTLVLMRGLEPGQRLECSPSGRTAASGGTAAAHKPTVLVVRRTARPW
jgi:hypothetical protein